MDGSLVDFRLLGFDGFRWSERFLRSLDDEISVARWHRSRAEVRRPAGIRTGEAMIGEIGLSCHVMVISAHAGWDDDGRAYLRGEGLAAYPYRIE